MAIQTLSEYISSFVSILTSTEELLGKHLILLDAVYIKRDNLPIILLYLRDETRKRHRVEIAEFNPYFFVDSKTSSIEKLINTTKIGEWFLEFKEETKIAFDGGKIVIFQKIVGKRPWEVPIMREICKNAGISFYEADIPYIHRFLIDTGIFGLDGVEIKKLGNSYSIKHNPSEFNPLILAMDIEIDSSNNLRLDIESFPSIIKSASRRVTTISITWGTTESDFSSHVFFLEKDDDGGERELLKNVFHFIWQEVDPDVIITYNGDMFDIPYLVRRSLVLGISSKILSPHSDSIPKEPGMGRGWGIPGVLVYDLFKKTKWLYTGDGKKSLDSVAQLLLGEGKLVLESTHGTAWKEALDNVDKRMIFENYAKKDAELTFKLFFKMKMIEWLKVIAISGIPPGEGIYFTERQTGEFLVFRHMYRNGILIPPAPTVAEKERRKKSRENVPGGLVLDPSRSIASSVMICDFTSMYPSIITSHNIGAESYIGGKKDPRHRFSEKPRSSMAIMQDEMLSKRIKVKEQLRKISDPVEYRKLKQYNTALKLVANSTFGSYNFIGSRFYNSQIGSCITAIGRNYINEISKKVEELGDEYRTIYGDTDSVFIVTPLHMETERLWKKHENDITENDLEPFENVLNFLRDLLPERMRLELQDIAYRILFHKGAKKRYTFVSAINKKVSILGLEAIRHDWSEFSKKIQKYTIDNILKTGDMKLTKNRIISFIRELVKEEKLKDLVTVLGPLKRNPEKYKSITPAVAAYYHYIKIKDLDAESTWKEFDHFPYVIVKGKGSLISRSRHPSLVTRDQIHVDYYIRKSLDAINRFNVNVSLNDIKGMKQMRLDDFFNFE